MSFVHLLCHDRHTHTSNNLPATVGEFVEVDVVLLVLHDDPGLELENLSCVYILSGALPRVGRA